MQCQQCQFENMPGLNRCMRCGSVLGAPQEPVSVMPPRMSRWKRPLRGIIRLFRLSGIRPPQDISVPPWAVKFISNSLFAAIFSIIPGLAQLLMRQFGSIFLYWLAWVVLFAMAIFFWGGGLGMFCFGLVLTLHVWIAMRAGVLQEFSLLRDRFIGFGVILLLYFYIYFFGSQYLMSRMHFQMGYSIINAPGQNVGVGSFLLGRTQDIKPQRGDFVYARLRGIGSMGSSGFVRVVGLPGEKVDIGNHAFRINEKALDSNDFPVPAGFIRAGGIVQLSAEQYFVVAEFHGTGYNINHIQRICVLTLKDFESKAFLRWWPLRSRGYIENPK